MKTLTPGRRGQPNRIWETWKKEFIFFTIFLQSNRISLATDAFGTKCSSWSFLFEVSFHVVRDSAPSPGFPAGLECASGSRPVIYTIIEFFQIELGHTKNHQYSRAWLLNGTKFAIVETTAPRLNGIWVSPDTTSTNKRLIKGIASRVYVQISKE